LVNAKVTKADNRRKGGDHLNVVRPTNTKSPQKREAGGGGEKACDGTMPEIQI